MSFKDQMDREYHNQLDSAQLEIEEPSEPVSVVSITGQDMPSAMATTMVNSSTPKQVRFDESNLQMNISATNPQGLILDPDPDRSRSRKKKILLDFVDLDI